MNEKQGRLTKSTGIIQKWINDSESNKHVQFSKNITLLNKTKKSKKTKQDSSSSINQDKQILNNSSISLTERINNKSNESSKNIYAPTATITESTFYRSANTRTLSFSSVASSSIPTSRRSSFSSNIFLEQQHFPSTISSIESPPSIISSSINKYRLPTFEYDLSLSDIDQKKLDDIQHLIPDEFEKLVPTLIKLGVIKFSKKLFQTNNEEMTTKELIERHHLISLIKKDEEKLKHQNYLERLYGNILIKDNINNKHILLRESLSFQGQLSLIAAYKDEIERELNKKFKHWKSISIQSIKTNTSEDSCSTIKPSFKSNSNQIRKKSLQYKSSIKSNTELTLTTNEQLSQIILPDHIDNQWQRKCIVNIIEQGMNLLDIARSLTTPILPNIYSNEQFIQDNIYDGDKIKFVKAFKRWVFLCYILYTDDQFFI